MSSLIHDLTMADVLAEHRRSRPKRLGLVCGDVRYSYPEFDERSTRLANAFSKAGVGKGDRVLWLGQNCHRFLESLLACAKLGAVFAPSNWRSSATEIVTLLDDAKPKIVIWQAEEIGERVEQARSVWRGKAVWLQHDPDSKASKDNASYEDFLSEGRANPINANVDPKDPFVQLYTGAFGGVPHGALLSHTAVLTQDLLVAMVQSVTEDTVYLNSGPMFHMATLMTTFATFHMGGTNVLTRRVDAEDICRVIEREKCNYGFVMGPTSAEILEVNKDGKYDLSSFRTFGGGKVWNEMVTVDSSLWGTHPAGYGQTEATGMLTFNAFGIGAIGTSGRPSPLAQVLIVDPDGNEVEPGETGEIVARGTVITNGYHDRKDLNEQKLRGGWWHTGDLGRREEDGSITFVAPLTRIVKSAAENVYPAEVEGCLRTHEAVREAAIIGVPDPKWTQIVVAVVVLKEGATASEEDLIEHCRAHIASYKKPSRVEFVDDLPKQGWAIDYAALDERFGGGGYPGLGTAAS